MRGLPVFLPAGRRIDVPRDRPHLHSFLNRFFKLSRGEAPDERQHPCGRSDVGERLPQLLCAALHGAVRFFRHLHPHFPQPIFRTACRYCSIGESAGLPLSHLVNPYHCAVGLRCQPEGPIVRVGFPLIIANLTPVPFGLSVSVPFAYSALTAVDRIHQG